MGDDLFADLQSEDVDLEVKKAAGKDGKGDLPDDFWETYSAMANTDGGYVVLGIQEKPKGNFCYTGIENHERVIKKLWDCLNDRDKISANLLSNQDVRMQYEQGKKIIIISIPRARREQRPVHLGKNPFGHTFRRNFEGDYRCDDETVRRMIADMVEEIRDSKILPHFDFDDLDRDSFTIYRQNFKTNKPNHPWNDVDAPEFLRLIGGWNRNRTTGESGLTAAGLLMFGRLRSILDAFPHYIIDYQERPEPKAEPRWVDRLTTDGTWSGNLYDFYRKVIQKLYADVKVPFVLEGAVRKDDTPVHEALREALTNTIVHADYTGRVSVLVVRRPDLYGFRNPGTMRIPLKLALQGGASDCRNRNIQKMFQLIGYGDQAGSGIPKILRNWMTNQHRRPPLWEEKLDPDQTLLTLPLASLIPEEALKRLDERFGPDFRQLPNVQRLALATVEIEGKVSHSRLLSMTTEHRTDITEVLRSLVKASYLIPIGIGRGTYYVFPGEEQKSEIEFFDAFSDSSMMSQNNEPGPGELQGDAVNKTRSEHLEPNSEHLEPNSEHLNQDLLSIARPVSDKRKANKQEVEKIIIKLCEIAYLDLRTLASLLKRSPDSLRNHYINPLVKAGELELRFPGQPNHPNQAYRTKSET